MATATQELGLEKSVRILADAARLEGTLHVPADAAGLVIFAHGSGSSRLSPRNTFVARELEQKGLATLLFDLLTEEESENRENVFDVQFLARRLLYATRWASRAEGIRSLPIGYFGASTGAGAALVAAAIAGQEIGAIVSRGGRPDLAGSALLEVRSPTLLIVGGDDDEVIRLNEWAYARMNCEKSLKIVPGATHLFAEPGSLDQVVRLAGDWFLRHLGEPRAE